MTQKVWLSLLVVLVFVLLVGAALTACEMSSSAQPTATPGGVRVTLTTPGTTTLPLPSPAGGYPDVVATPFPYP